MSSCGCTGLPPLTLRGQHNSDAPSGPKVASLIANLKCELWDAANSTRLLSFHNDKFGNGDSVGTKNHIENSADSRSFTLHNIFAEIEYVGEATFTLDVTQTSGFNPSASIAKHYSAANGELPPTGAVLSVGGQLSEAAHRYVNIYSSADFSRLVESQSNPFVMDPSSPFAGAPSPHLLADEPTTCDGGSELKGNLGMKETLADGIQAATMNDIAVFPTTGGAPGGGPNPIVPIPSTYPVGQISAQVDFTIIEGVNGGPTWSLNYFSGPGGNASGLFNFQRQVKDTLVVTFLPVCIRSHYWTNDVAPPFRYSSAPHPSQFDDESPLTKHSFSMVDGTPGWANYLPPCDSAYHLTQQANALSQAKNNNDQILLQTSPSFRQIP